MSAERRDGRGYPEGIAGTAIPLGARIVSVADALDAITSDRIYRNARELREALEVIADEADRQFDADVVCALQQWVADVCIRQGWGDIPTAGQLLATQSTATALDNEILAADI